MRPGCLGRMERAAHLGAGAGGRLRTEPKAGDLADDPRWESRRAQVQKDLTQLAARDRGLHTIHSAVTPGAGCHRELSGERNQGAQGCDERFRPGLSGSRAPVFNLGSPLWDNRGRGAQLHGEHQEAPSHSLRST